MNKRKVWEVVAYSDDPWEDPINICDSKQRAVSLARQLKKAGYKFIEVHAHDGTEIIDSTIQYF